MPEPDNPQISPEPSIEQQPVELDELNKLEKPAVTDSAEPEQAPQSPDNNSTRFGRFKFWYLSRKKWTIPVTLALIIITLIAVPWTRYHTLGLVLKKNYTLKIVDSATNTPVSGAVVSSGTKSVETNGSGKAVLRLGAGPHHFSLSKKYYKSQEVRLTVPLMSEKDIPTLKLDATGRQVSVSIINVISKKPLSNVQINVADIKAKTDKSGKATLVLPVSQTQQKATLSLGGYNDSKVIIKLSNSKIEENDYSLTPAGKIYFLSKLSGKIDVVKTNLDGTQRTTVVAGTGSEEDTNTVLLASRDWKYLALQSKRGADLPKLYVINTDNDQLLTMDEGSADFSMVGWYNHFFIYKIARKNFNSWQPNATSVKSYDAQTGKLITLVNSNASGSSNGDAQFENIFDSLIFGNDIVYTRTWYRYPGYLDVAGKQNLMAAIHPDGTSSRDIKTVDAGTSYFSNLKLNKPRELYFGIYSNVAAATGYYVLDKNAAVSQSSSLSDKDLGGDAKTYLSSPTSGEVFWAEERDGKNALLIGDQDGGASKQIATLSSYNTYGWFFDDYLLVSKNSSELYIIPRTGVSKDSDALKITDYHKPALTYYGYGGGYGGL